MNKIDFNKLLMGRYDELPFTIGLDDGQYNEGVLDGFMDGALWAYDLLTTNGKHND